MSFWKIYSKILSILEKENFVIFLFIYFFLTSYFFMFECYTLTYLFYHHTRKNIDKTTKINSLFFSKNFCIWNLQSHCRIILRKTNFSKQLMRINLITSLFDLSFLYWISHLNYYVGIIGKRRGITSLTLAVKNLSQLGKLSHIYKLKNMEKQIKLLLIFFFSFLVYLKRKHFFTICIRSEVRT